ARHRPRPRTRADRPGPGRARGRPDARGAVTRRPHHCIPRTSSTWRPTMGSKPLRRTPGRYALGALAATGAVLAATACSTPEGGGGDGDAAEGPFTIGVSNGFIGSEWREQMLSTLERSEEHTSELQSRENLVCRLLLE